MVKKKKRIDSNVLEKLINPKRLRVLRIIQKEGQIHPWKLKDKINLSYRQTRRYLESLEKVGAIKKTRVKDFKGSPVFFSIKPPKKKKTKE